jgi:hypothetical protein
MKKYCLEEYIVRLGGNLGEFSKIPWKFKTYGIMGKDK